jgi:[acyl-carrier-protein] S-malonyltransferase
MKESGELHPGGMAAVVGLDEQALREVVQEAQSAGVVTLANANSPGQTVLSGEVVALTRAMELAKARGARLVQRLAVSIASHSPLMQQASQHFNELISRINLRTPEVPLISNITAQALTTVEDLRNELSEQLTRPVQWTRSVQEMVSRGVDTFVEIGPKQVLSGLIKRITPESQPITVTDAEIVKLLTSLDA